MKKLMKRLMILLGMILILAGSCKEQGGEGVMVGKWKQIGATQTMEFFKDGKVIVMDKGELPLAGDYRLIDDNLKMNLALFGPISAKVSSSRDEIILINPFGKVEKYRRAGVENKRIERQKKIAGKYVIDKEPGILIFEQDGTITRHLAGRWETKRGWIKLYEGNKEIKIGGISSDTIKYGGRTFIKQRGAEAIQLLSAKDSSSGQRMRVQFVQLEADCAPSFVPVNFTLWSDYIASDNVSTIKFKKDGTFLIKDVLDHKWRIIKDGIVQVYNKEMISEGRIEGSALIFERGEDKRIFTKQG